MQSSTQFFNFAIQDTPSHPATTNSLPINNRENISQNNIIQVEHHATSIKVSARVKKGEFSKFLISGRLDKVFQELSLKKIHKKVLFQCKVIGR